MDDYRRSHARDKLRLIRGIRRKDGSSRWPATRNDAPALARADVAVAMNSGTQTAKGDTGNMVDLDSNPGIAGCRGRQADDHDPQRPDNIQRRQRSCKYFAIIPAAFVCDLSPLAALNVMGSTAQHRHDPVRGDFQRADHRWSRSRWRLRASVPG